MAVATSGTFNALSITAEIVIRDAFENIGITSEFLDVAKYNAAMRSLNFLMQEWASKSYNLWTVQSEFLPLNQGQSAYALPNYVSDIVQMNTRSYTVPENTLTFPPFGEPASSFARQLNGTPRTNTGATYDNGGGGTPAFAFDGNPATACTQNAANGNISYDFGAGTSQIIASVGITSSVTRVYNLVIAYSQDSVTWNISMTLPAFEATAGANLTFTIPNPVLARYYRVRETSGAVLSMTEIIFNSGIAENAFDNDPTTACTQNVANGNISYGYNTILSPDNSQVITLVGITSNVTRDYTLSIQAVDFISRQFVVLLSIPKQSYPQGITQWFTIPKPINATSVYIAETGGAILNIQELYFANNTTDLNIANIALYTYQNYPQKDAQGRPCTYYLQRNTNNSGSSPVLNLWPAPDNYWNLIQYTYQKMMQDVTYLSQGIDVPARFYSAMVWGLSWRLAMKYKPELAGNLKAEYQESFKIATIEDSESVPVTITISDEGY